MGCFPRDAVPVERAARSDSGATMQGRHALRDLLLATFILACRVSVWTTAPPRRRSPTLSFINGGSTTGSTRRASLVRRGQPCANGLIVAVGRNRGRSCRRRRNHACRRSGAFSCALVDFTIRYYVILRGRARALGGSARSTSASTSRQMCAYDHRGRVADVITEGDAGLSNRKAADKTRRARPGTKSFRIPPPSARVRVDLPILDGIRSTSVGCALERARNRSALDNRHPSLKPRGHGGCRISIRLPGRCS